jgi:hypothetical protein
MGVVDAGGEDLQDVYASTHTVGGDEGWARQRNLSPKESLHYARRIAKAKPRPFRRVGELELSH